MSRSTPRRPRRPEASTDPRSKQSARFARARTQLAPTFPRRPATTAITSIPTKNQVRALSPYEAIVSLGLRDKARDMAFLLARTLANDLLSSCLLNGQHSR